MMKILVCVVPFLAFLHLQLIHIISFQRIQLVSFFIAFQALKAALMKYCQEGMLQLFPKERKQLSKVAH